MRVPAVCDNCGAIFPSSFEVSNSTNISFNVCSSGPCPVCGGMGHIPDGVYNFIGNTIEFLSGPKRSINELEQLATLLHRARTSNVSTDALARELDESIPELASIKDWLPKTRTELYAFIALLLSTLTLIISQIQSGEPSKVEVNTVINNVYQQAPETQSSPSSEKREKQKVKVGRNETCPCGSGKKFKKCCLP